MSEIDVIISQLITLQKDQAELTRDLDKLRGDYDALAARTLALEQYNDMTIEERESEKGAPFKDYSLFRGINER